MSLFTLALPMFWNVLPLLLSQPDRRIEPHPSFALSYFLWALTLSSVSLSVTCLLLSLSGRVGEVGLQLAL